MSRHPVIVFRLYIAGDALNSLQALANLKKLCGEHLPERHAIEVVDVFHEPRRALADRIFMTPTLLKLSPAPACKLVGTLSQVETVLQALGLRRIAA